MVGHRLAAACALALSMGIAPSAWAVEVLSDGERRLELTGNLQWDFGRVDRDNASDDPHGAWRRRRLGLLAKPAANLELAAEYDFAAGAFTDVVLRWKTGWGSWHLGQFKQPFLLDELTSDKRTLLLEPGLPHVFALSRRLGAGWSWNPAALGLQLSAFDRNLDGTRSTRGVAARGWWTPWHGDSTTVHLGLAVTAEDAVSGSVALSVRPESRLPAPRAARLPALDGVTAVHRVGVESLWLSGPWYGQGEWVQQACDRRAQADVRGQGWYLQVGRTFGSGRRQYKQGTPQAVDAGNTLEVGLRWSGIDLDDGAVRGGRAQVLGIGATWYLQPETRVQINLLDVDRRGGTPGAAATDYRILETRLQWAF